MQRVLDYTEWRKFEDVIDKAKVACEQSNNNVSDYFVDADKIVKTGISEKIIKDYYLSRYACYLIALSGDNRKKVIALAKTYFAVQTRKQNSIKIQMIVKDQVINVLHYNNSEYISLTDLARYADSEEPRLPIRDWMRNKDVISFLGLWETIHNENFKGGEFTTFKSEAGSNRFKMSPQKWIRTTNAIGIISKSGRYDGGTFAHSDIALEFASWLSPEFKLYVIQEFQRLKKKESYRNKDDWHANRLLASINYIIHTAAIKNIIIPSLTEKQKKYIYAEEADVINVALFGMTAKEWRDLNPTLAEEGNIRDYTDLLHLVILSNLENINAELIEMGLPQSERLIKLNSIAIKQIKLLNKNKTLEKLKYIDNKQLEK